MDYVAEFQSRLINAFIEIVRESNHVLADIICKKRKIETIGDEKERIRLYNDLWQGLSDEVQYQLSDADAKINDLARRARKIAATSIVRNHDIEGHAIADSIDFVIRRYREQDVPANVVQQHLDSNARAWFSLTAHPTNPTTLRYTKAGVLVDKALEKSGCEGDITDAKDQLYSALRNVRDARITGQKRTVAEEVEEATLLLDVIYDSVIDQRNAFEEALCKYGYKKDGVRVKLPLTTACLWAAGDGDGNPNTTVKTLSAARDFLNNSIINKYKDDISLLGLSVGDASFSSVDELNKALEEHGSCTEDLRYKLSVFGLHYAQIDIRHNADDFMKVLVRLIECTDIVDTTTFLMSNQDTQLNYVLKWLEDKQAICKFAAIKSSEMGDDKEGELSSRVMDRLCWLAEYPHMSDKLIIAENQHVLHVITAMLLLKVSGNIVGQSDAALDIVTLSESVEDLEMLQEMHQSLLEYPIWYNHLLARQRLIVMIAKSDTVRLAGRGAELAQEQATASAFTINYQDKDLPFPITVFSGGGAALQRGGGKPSEVAHGQARAAMSVGVKTLGAACQTVQGHQMQLLFSPLFVCSYYLEALAAQGMFALGQVSGVLPVRDLAECVDKTQAYDATILHHTASREAYSRYTANPSFNELLENGPWVSVKLGNLSSRPSKRDGDSYDSDCTPQEIKGNKPKLLDNRAITVERMATHSGTQLVSILGEKEGLLALVHKGEVSECYTGSSLRYVYEGNKLERDSMRNTAIAIYMQDFANAWRMLIGVERPADSDIETLSQKFLHSFEEKENLPEVTLAFIERYSWDIACLIYTAITGTPPKEGMKSSDVLKHCWPDLADQMDSRERLSEFARFIEAKLTHQMNEYTDVRLTERQTRIIQSIYAAADVKNAPVGMLATVTRIDDESGLPMVRIRPDIADNLPLPSAL